MFDTQRKRDEELEADGGPDHRRPVPFQTQGPSFATQGPPPWDPITASASPFGGAVWDPLSGRPQPQGSAEVVDPITTGAPIQRFAEGEGQSPDAQRTAQRGVSGGGGALPHLDEIQRAFGPAHDLSQVRAHTGGAAADAAGRLGAAAYATGNDVAFARPPDLHLAAHEAAHVVQQRAGVQLAGGVGRAGDAYERHADAVADAVVRGESAAPLLQGTRGARSEGTAVQLHKLSDEEQKLLDEFKTKSYSKKDHTPAGGGKFDLSCIVATRLLQVTVRIKFDFQDAVGANPKFKELQKWKAEDKAKWKAEFISQVTARWSGKHTFSVNKPGWEEFKFKPLITAVATDEDPHYTVTVRRQLPGNFVPRSNVSKQGTGDMEAEDIKPKGESDPNEAKNMSENVTKQERERVHAGVARIGNPIQFPQRQYAVPAATIPSLKSFGELLAARGPSAPVFHIVLKGESKDDAQDAKTAEWWAQRRAQEVGDWIAGRARGYPVTVFGGSGGAGRQVTVEAAGEPDWAYHSEFTTAEHEFGHMLGNPDEYKEAEGTGHVHDQDRKKRWDALVKSAGVAVPMKGEEGASTSIMSQGVDVLPAHYVTIWDCLGELTPPHVKKSEWSIG